MLGIKPRTESELQAEASEKPQIDLNEDDQHVRNRRQPAIATELDEPAMNDISDNYRLNTKSPSNVFNPNITAKEKDATYTTEANLLTNTNPSRKTSPPIKNEFIPNADWLQYNEKEEPIQPSNYEASRSEDSKNADEERLEIRTRAYKKSEDHYAIIKEEGRGGPTISDGLLEKRRKRVRIKNEMPLFESREEARRRRKQTLLETEGGEEQTDDEDQGTRGTMQHGMGQSEEQDSSSTNQDSDEAGSAIEVSWEESQAKDAERQEEHAKLQKPKEAVDLKIRPQSLPHRKAPAKKKLENPALICNENGKYRDQAKEQPSNIDYSFPIGHIGNPYWCQNLGFGENHKNRGLRHGTTMPWLWVKRPHLGLLRMCMRIVIGEDGKTSRSPLSKQVTRIQGQNDPQMSRSKTFTQGKTTSAQLGQANPGPYHSTIS
ncbi:MAG: hypothetical protein Q9170_005956 [Blastenia crenularia]